MSIQTELTRITNAKTAIKTAIEGKGVTVPDGTMLDGMAALIETIEAGGSGGGMATGTFTPTEFISLRNQWYTINHGLKKLPKYIFVWNESDIKFNGTRTAYQIYAVLASPTHVLFIYQQSSTSYGSHYSAGSGCDWLTDPQIYGKPNISIGYVTENSFTVGANVLNVGFSTSTYRWVVVA